MIVFHEKASRLSNEMNPNGCVIEMLLVPSEKFVPDIVLTMIDWGVDTYPVESRTVMTRPGVWILDSSTTATPPAVNTDVSTRTTDVLAFICICVVGITLLMS